MQKSLAKRFRQANTPAELTTHAKEFLHATGKTWQQLSAEITSDTKNDATSLKVAQMSALHSTAITKENIGLNGEIAKITMQGKRNYNEDRSLATFFGDRRKKNPALWGF